MILTIDAITSDQKSRYSRLVMHYFISYMPSYAPFKIIIDGSFRHYRQGRSFLTFNIATWTQLT